MESQISELLYESIATKVFVAEDPSLLKLIAKSAAMIQKVRDNSGTVYACGNGGSTCDAMHLCEELVAKYKRMRPGIRAMHLMDASTLTCWGNDVGFDDAFARVAETFCTKSDLLVAISTSGNSKNVIQAAKVAKRKGCKVVGLLGRDGGKLKSLCDVSIIIPATSSERIQELHITIIHIWCELLETTLSSLKKSKRPTKRK